MSLPFWGHKFLMVTTGQERTSSHISTAESQPLTPGEKSLVTPPRHLHPSTALAPRGSLEGRREDSESRDVCAPHSYYFCPPAPKYWHVEGPSVDQEMLLQSPSFAEGACILVKARGCAQAPTQAHAVSWGHVLQPAQVQAPAVLVGHGLPTMATSALREMTRQREWDQPRPCPCPCLLCPFARHCSCSAVFPGGTQAGHAPQHRWAPHCSTAGSNHTRTKFQGPVFFCSVVSSLGCPGKQPPSREIKPACKQCRELTFLTRGHCTRTSKAASPCFAHA